MLTNVLSDSTRAYSTRNEGRMTAAFCSLFPFRYWVSKSPDPAINNPRGCQVTSLRCKHFDKPKFTRALHSKLFLAERLLFENLCTIYWFTTLSTVPNVLLPFYSIFLWNYVAPSSESTRTSLLCLFVFFFTVAYRSQNAHFRYVGIEPIERERNSWSEGNAKNVMPDISKTRGHDMVINVTILFTTVASS